MNTRTNTTNDGRAFQADIETTLHAYRVRGMADLRKTEPPTRVLGGGHNRRVIFMANPFLDYLGTWSERHGRAIVVEAKSTATHRLPVNRDGGLTAEQCHTMANWRKAGAAVALLWRWRNADAGGLGPVTLWTPEMVWQRIGWGEASLKHEDGIPVGQGPGTRLVDFLPVLAAQLWPRAPVCAENHRPE